ncbi:pyridoxamine 5'-phosphate oxidase [Mycobacterium paraffinicum]|uniref:Pyridoxamine 5'-phosphate oxidase n=1 Tax=Mycobacterium paraffinicum TaxID=53378 RepID=A0A1Q4I2Q2_9MYCO|nr:pyridoxamine 5'-phosphate oxidase family protein [Mycobacterium paraffinicum]OJZ76223.1 pyridoxamine 5'-phosphate oxidase [Mycobacterium paraffinicum]
MSRALTFERVVRELSTQHFAILCTVDQNGRPDSAGVSYGAWAREDALMLYVMTRRHLRKARNIADNPEVSLVVPLQRRVLRFVPPATIQLHGRAEVLDWSDVQGTNVFRGFWMGRQILGAYEESRRAGETRVCFLKITLDPVVRSYGVGHSVWNLRRHMAGGADTVRLGGDSA